jgi:hypothetical protein
MCLLTNTFLCGSLLTLVVVTAYTDNFQSISQFSQVDGFTPTVEVVSRNNSTKHRGSGRITLAQYDA